MKDFQAKTKPKKEAGKNTLPPDSPHRPRRLQKKRIFAKGATLIRIPILSVLFWLVLLYSGPGNVLLPAFAAALIHEAGHLFVIRLCGVTVTQITLYPFGADIRREGKLTSYFTDLLICGAGIAANLTAAAVCLPFLRQAGVMRFLLANLSLAVLNLMPVALLDGGGMLTALLCRFCGAEKAERAVMGISFFTVVLLWILSLYILFYSSSNFSLFLLCAYLFSALFLPPAGTEDFS